jgi:hypothetical protein
MSRNVAADTKNKVTQAAVPLHNLVPQHRFTFPQHMDNTQKAEENTLRNTPAESGFGHDFRQIRVHAPAKESDTLAMQSCLLALTSPRACPFGGACHACPARVQAKLAVSQPEDTYEREADRIADSVVRGGPESRTPCPEHPAQARAAATEPLARTC